MARCVAGGSLFLLVIGLGLGALGQGSDQDQLEQLLEDYVAGWREADVKRLEKVFALEEGRVMWVSDASGQETLSSMTFAQVLERRKPQPEYGLEWSILSLDVVGGRLAVAKVRISRAGGSYIDFLVCQKIADRWKIINKTFLTQ
ncbi:MAG TPA: nuclear transport factor 2 family protein [Acidobacteriota bacterium]|nr:nuclear transport factor 2 family protein [Acidobacteriota bacterium]